MATAQRESSRSSRVVPIIVAVIGAAGVVIAAWLARDGDSSNGTGSGSTVSTETTESSEAPNIAGRYYLDPGNPRVIIVRNVGVDSYTVEEELPASWPFEGTVEWTDDDTYRGRATFAAGTEMWITLVPLSDGSLRTTFDYITDNDGAPLDRVDEHLLVPE